MPSLNLSGSAISYTYQRLLQTDGVNVYDGTGSLFVISGSGSSSFPYTGSAEITGSLTVTGSIQVTGNVTASYFVGIIDGGTF